MKLSRLDVFLAVAVAAVMVAAPTTPNAAPVITRGEVARIQAHLETVEGELLRRDVSELSPEQRAARSQHIGVLREYRERGLFPHNHDFPGSQRPFFVDHQGTHCAMAYLIARSGRPDLVERVARSRNNAYVPELADDPLLAAWLDSAGISLQEAARIQPAVYEWGPPEAEAQSERVSTEYALMSALSIGFGGVSIAQNLPGNRGAPGWRGAYGLLIGAYGIALGAPKLDESGASQLLGVLNTAVGSTAALLGAHTLWQGRRGSSQNGSATVSASPVVRADGGAGVLVQVRY